MLRGFHWEDPLIVCQVGRFSDIHWESHLFQMVDLRESLLMGCWVGMVLESFRVNHWESHLVQNM